MDANLIMEHKISMRSTILPTIQKEFNRLLKSKKWCDANVKGFTRNGEKSSKGVACHQLVLALASPVIRHALQKAMDGSRQMCCCEQQTAIKNNCFVFDGQIILADASNRVVESIIPFIYGKSVPENIELKKEISGWLNALQIEEYRYERNMDSDTEILDENDISENGTNEDCDMAVARRNQCIACKKTTFHSNEVELYIEHLSTHKTAMLEQLKESKKTPDGNKKFFCDMCQKMILAAQSSDHFRKCFTLLKSEIDKQKSNEKVPESLELGKPKIEVHLPRISDGAKRAAVNSISQHETEGNMFPCALCKKSFKHNFALKKHTCPSIETRNKSSENLGKPTSSMNNCLQNVGSLSSHLVEPKIIDIKSLHGREQMNFEYHKIKGDVSKANDITSKDEKGKLSSGVSCTRCKEIFPTKFVLRLHSCKSPKELKAAKRENIELFNSRSQRRSAEKSIITSADKSIKKIKILKRTEQQDEYDTNINSVSSLTNISLRNIINKDYERNSGEIEDDDFKDFEVPIKGSPEPIQDAGENYASNYTRLDTSSSPKRLVIDLAANDSEATRSPSPILQIVNNEIENASFEELSRGKKLFENSTPISIGSLQVEQTVSCEQCGKPFSSQSVLTDHILEEHDTDPFG